MSSEGLILREWEMNPQSPAAEQALDRVEADLYAERYSAAREAIAKLAIDELRGPAFARAAVLRARCDALHGEALDLVVMDARRALARVELDDERALLRAEIAYALVAKRCEPLARREAEAIEALSPASSLGPAVHAWIDLRNDRRPDALAHYERAEQLADAWRGTFGVARVAYVLGDLERCEAALARVEGRRETEARRLRLLADVARVRGRWERVLELLDAIAEVTPGGDYARFDAIERAVTLFKLDRREEGLSLYKTIWREREDDGAGRFARAVLTHVERAREEVPSARGPSSLATVARPGRRRAMLPEFPTVTQKRNYCGPATLELVLRALRVDERATQDEIAARVKRETGTPVIAMRRYLEGCGLEARRFEATPAKLYACIAAGLPVIVEEEYSTTNHVAVVIGVDEELGVLHVQDPMTHVTNTRLASTQGELGQHFRNAALVAFRKGDEAAAAALDSAEVVDAPHIALIDECGDDAIAEHPEEVLRRCARAIELCEDYPLAWSRQAWALFGHLRRYRTKNNEKRFLAMLRQVRIRYASHEWPHQVHGHFLMEEGRHEEALIEFEEALRLDPGDSNNAQYIAECHQQLGRDDSAVEAFRRALKIDPAHVRATENYAALALDGGEVAMASHLSECACVMAPGNPFNWATASRVAERRDDEAGALAHARKATEVEPDYADGQIRLATLLRGAAAGLSGVGADGAPLDGREEARAIFARLIERWPQWFDPRVRCAGVLRDLGRAAEAIELLLHGIQIAQDEPAALARELAEILIEEGRAAEALAHLERLARARPTVAIRSEYFDYLDRLGVEPDGREATKAFLDEHPESPYALATHATWLLGGDEAQEVEAEALLRRAVEGAPTYHWARRRLMFALARTRPEEALAIAEASPEPDAWTLLDAARIEIDAGRDPMATLERALGEGGVDGWYGQEIANRALLSAVAGEGALAPEKALEKVRAALDAEDAPALFRRRARLAFALAAADDDAALALLESIPEGDAPTRTLLVHGADCSEALRPLLESRLAAMVDDRKRSHDERAWARGVLIGSRAASAADVPAALGVYEAWLSEQRAIEPLERAMTTLSATRQHALLAKTRAALAALPIESARVAQHAAFVDSHRGDHRGAASRLRAARARWSRDGSLTVALAAELLLLEPAGWEEARALARKALAQDHAWAHTYEVAALAELAAGDRAEAERCSRAAWLRYAAMGYRQSELPLLRAGIAALAGDVEALEAARSQRGNHGDPDAPIWGALRAKG